MPSVIMTNVVMPIFVFRRDVQFNGTARFIHISYRLNTNIFSYLETSGGKSYNTYLNGVHFFNTSVN
jgi:hypothetical protein